MTTREFLIAAWTWNPWVVAIGATVIAAQALFWPGQPLRTRSWLIGGVGVFVVALCSPIAALADGYLFSAHMLQHLMLLLIVPALVLLGIPSSTLPNHGENGRWNWMNRALSRPIFPWLCGVGGMWLWHVPALCNAAVTHAWIHELQSVSLVLMGAAFWWPIIGPWSAERLSPLSGVIYLFTACVGCTLLGVLITFAPVGVCSIYLHPTDRLGIMTLIRGQWGVTPGTDQQLGGLLMWVPACLIYLCGICGLLARWYGSGAEVPAGLTPARGLTETHG